MARKNKHITHEDRKKRALNLQKWQKEINLSLKKSNLKTASFKRKIEVLAQSNGFHQYYSKAVHPEIAKGFTLFVGKAHLKKSETFKALLLLLDRKNCMRFLDHTNCLIGLSNIASRHQKFIRDINDWEKTSHNPEKQLSSLLRHLFCAYPVPAFLDTAWQNRAEKKYCDWLPVIGVGISIRKLNHIPIKMSKKIAHAFGNSPDNLSVHEALRWAQVIGKGGNERLANMIIQSRLGRHHFEDENFWDGGIQFFINAGMFDWEKIGEIVDYLIATRALDRDYSLKGRTIISVIRASNSWHNDQEALRSRGGFLTWQASGIYEARSTEGKDHNKVDYSIIELRSSKELIQEGKKMNHCVASYATACHKKRRAIFSIRKKDRFNTEETLATIEVLLQHNKIVQAKAQYNKPISPKALSLLKDWAYKENLIIPGWILKR